MLAVEEEAKINSNKGIHERVFNDRLMDMDGKNVCGSHCVNGKACLKSIKLQSIIDARIDFWGIESKPMNREDKYTKLYDLVSKKGTNRWSLMIYNIRSEIKIFKLQSILILLL